MSDRTEPDELTKQKGTQEMSNVSIEMPKYRSHKIVWALKIKDIAFDFDAAKDDGDRETDGSAIITPAEAGYAPFKVGFEFVRKHLFKTDREIIIGGYYVVYADGYTSFSPAKAFDEGYTRI